MKYFSHLNSAAEILHLYKGAQPFHHFIKDFFRQHKKYGSKDRKNISQLCYAFFRTGKMFDGLPIEERIISSLSLCSSEPSESFHKWCNHHTIHGTTLLEDTHLRRERKR